MFIRSILLILLGWPLWQACDSGDDTISPPTPTPISFPRDLQTGIGNHGSLGVFDPSLAKDPHTGKLWMSFSGVAPSGNMPMEYIVSLHLAYSTDNGFTWAYHGQVVPAVEITTGLIDNLAGSTPNVAAGTGGAWLNETSSLVYDPYGKAGEEWKLVWHNYLRVDDNPATQESTRNFHIDFASIHLKVAASPEDLASATTHRFINGILFHGDNFTPGSPAYPQITSASLFVPPTDIGGSDLDLCLVAEPDLHVDSTGLYFAFSCPYLSSSNPLQHAALFKCDHPCDITNASNTWNYLGKFGLAAEALPFGSNFVGFSAVDLFSKGSETFVVMTPRTTMYSGCVLFRFSDLQTATLETEGGQLKSYGSYLLTDGTHHGACSYHEDADTLGLFLSQHYFEVPVHDFNIHQLGISP